MWGYLRRDTKIEVTRYFTIWRDKSLRLKSQKLRLQKLIWRKYFNKLNGAFNTWSSYSYYLDSQIRLRVLAAEYA